MVVATVVSQAPQVCMTPIKSTQALDPDAGERDALKLRLEEWREKKGRTGSCSRSGTPVRAYQPSSSGSRASSRTGTPVKGGTPVRAQAHKENRTPSNSLTRRSGNQNHEGTRQVTKATTVHVAAAPVARAFPDAQLAEACGAIPGGYVARMAQQRVHWSHLLGGGENPPTVAATAVPIVRPRVQVACTPQVLAPRVTNCIPQVVAASVRTGNADQVANNSPGVNTTKIQPKREKDSEKEIQYRRRRYSIEDMYSFGSKEVDELVSAGTAEMAMRECSEDEMSEASDVAQARRLSELEGMD